MKLAEALIKRGNSQKRIEVLREKLLRYAKVQEGDKPAESPDDIYKELNDSFNELTEFIQRINKTNAEVLFDDKRTIADVLAYRDVLIQKYNLTTKLITSATDIGDRYSKKEIKILSTIDVKEYQKEADKLAKEYRELDLKIQEKNWSVDLL
ncbi:MAG: DIP1984 family protein [Ignavibacteriae bacterium]|nr:DIP1984 family protein [Ignavibacteriota bacterium]